jgi:hypothetical protein
VSLPACTPRGFVSGSTNPTTVAPGAAFQVSCNYGDGTYGYIFGNNCSSFAGFQGTAAVFNCTAPSTPGSYAESCNLGTGPTQYYCARNFDPAGTLTVANPSVSVSVSPATVSLASAQQQQFSATVTGSANTSVTWSMNPSVGSLTSSGLYTAPYTISAGQTVTVTATSAADPSKSGSASASLQACTPRGFVSGSTIPTSVGPGAAYQISCDYGDSTYGYISATTATRLQVFKGQRLCSIVRPRPRRDPMRRVAIWERVRRNTIAPETSIRQGR